MLIINLAVFDLTMAFNMPHYLINAILGYFQGGDLGCDLYAVFGSISGIGAAITNAIIAYDRYRYDAKFKKQNQFIESIVLQNYFKSHRWTS